MTLTFLWSWCGALTLSFKKLAYDIQYLCHEIVQTNRLLHTRFLINLCNFRSFIPFSVWYYSHLTSIILLILAFIYGNIYLVMWVLFKCSHMDVVGIREAFA